MRSAFAVIVDFLTLVGLACVVGSGAVMRWVLMPGSESLAYPIGKRFRLGYPDKAETFRDSICGIIYSRIWLKMNC